METLPMEIFTRVVSGLEPKDIWTLSGTSQSVAKRVGECSGLVFRKFRFPQDVPEVIVENFHREESWNTLAKWLGSHFGNVEILQIEIPEFVCFSQFPAEMEKNNFHWNLVRFLRAWFSAEKRKMNSLTVQVKGGENLTAFRDRCFDFVFSRNTEELPIFSLVKAESILKYFSKESRKNNMNTLNLPYFGADQTAGVYLETLRGMRNLRILTLSLNSTQFFMILEKIVFESAAGTPNLVEVCLKEIHGKCEPGVACARHLGLPPRSPWTNYARPLLRSLQLFVESYFLEWDEKFGHILPYVWPNVTILRWGSVRTPGTTFRVQTDSVLRGVAGLKHLKNLEIVIGEKASEQPIWEMFEAIGPQLEVLRVYFYGEGRFKDGRAVCDAACMLKHSQNMKYLLIQSAVVKDVTKGIGVGAKKNGL